MELILAIGIGVMVGAGVWLLLRPRSFQVIIGLSLLSYAVNLFIFSTGGLRTGAAPILERGATGDLATHADPVPQALVLTAIVIGFALTVVLMSLVLRAWRGEGTINAARITAAEPPFPEDEEEDADAR